MSSSDLEPRRSGGGGWFFASIAVLLFVGGALSVAAYIYAEPELTVFESVAAGFAGLAALIIGLIAAAFGVIVGIIGALIGLVTAGGAIAMTLFIIGSPIIAIILFVLLLRRPKACPDPSVHE